MALLKAINLDDPPIVRGKVQTWIIIIGLVGGSVWAWADHNYRITDAQKTADKALALASGVAHAQDVADKALAMASENSKILDKLAQIQGDLRELKGNFDQYVAAHSNIREK